MSSGAEAGPRHVVEHATCTACGCLCDDIAVAVQAGRIVEARNACSIGVEWFLREHSRPETEATCVDGRPVSRDEALECATRLLAGSRAPLIVGLSRSPSETTAAALALADRIGAVVDTDLGGQAAARLRAYQRVGRVSATLGEVRSRADVVVFWGVDPVTTHPRHFERYSVAPRGRFLAGGRVVVVAAETRNATALRADLFFAVPRDRHFEVLWTLRALVRGAAVDAERSLTATGLEVSMLAAFAEGLKQARYGAWFSESTPGDPALTEATLALVRDLNESTRFVALGLGAPGNASGAEAVTAWQTGIPGRVYFAANGPRSWPGETEANAMLARGEADLAVIVGDDVSDGLRADARAALARIPRIVIAPRATDSPSTATVGFATTTPGIDAGGTVTRNDGIVLSLRPALAARFPTDREWLLALHDRLDPRADP